jgi:hypothetical protein
MAGANLVAAMGYGSVRGCDAQCGDGGAQRGEPSVVVPIGRGAPAQPDTEDLDAAIVADGPHGCSAIATAARRHTGGQVLVIAVGCGDAAALLAVVIPDRQMVWPGRGCVCFLAAARPLMTVSVTVRGPKSTRP